MNRLIFIWLSAFLVLVKLSNPASAQSRFIIAGVWDTTDHYQDIVPDSVIKYWQYYYLDVNDDSITDFIFAGRYTSVPLIWGKMELYISAVNGEVHAECGDPFHKCLKIYDFSDTIRNDNKWFGNTERTICYYEYYKSVAGNPGSMTYFRNGLNDKYLGIRYFIQSDTLYGWVMISTGNYPDNITLQEWAMNKPVSSSGIGESKLTNSLRISPNPFRNETTLYSLTPLHSATLNIYNARGKRVRQMKNVSGHTIPILRYDLPAGLYFLHLTQQSSEPVTIKLIISD